MKQIEEYIHNILNEDQWETFVVEGYEPYKFLVWLEQYSKDIMVDIQTIVDDGMDKFFEYIKQNNLEQKIYIFTVKSKRYDYDMHDWYEFEGSNFMYFKSKQAALDYINNVYNGVYDENELGYKFERDEEKGVVYLTEYAPYNQ